MYELTLFFKSLSDACDAFLAVAVSCGDLAGIALVLPASAAGYRVRAEAIVPAAARTLPRAAGSDDGFVQICRGRDNLES